MSTDKKESKVDVVKAEGDVLWNEIKDKPMNIFGLRDQKVFMHVGRLDIPSKLLLKLRSTAVLPALEEALGSKYVVIQNEKFVSVERAKEELSF